MLAAFNTHLGDTHGAIAARHDTSLYVGGITLSSTLIFWQLAKTRPHPKEVEAVAEWR
ncbi:MFS transporter [Xanthomonas oryzae pv. oryzae]|nr:MFS transporter [Xanthomonas oryzae pv. oryzae]QUW75124.1 MFS transporter [Xanthomonas oryzae]AOS15492.1 MFS transporter [Xanthomonas oryzae pv. oryzae]AOS18747.1 MFS transporter [Xanthomonas oryzae pv. oryzae]AOS22914.1 MFS transporter [Xanthomonas oryzae pv. oryzae]